MLSTLSATSSSIISSWVRQLLLTGSHEFIDFGWASLRLFHAIPFLQEVVDLRQINARVWRHAIGGNFP